MNWYNTGINKSHKVKMGEIFLYEYKRSDTQSRSFMGFMFSYKSVTYVCVYQKQLFFSILITIDWKIDEIYT